MKPLFGPEGRVALEQFVQRPTLIALDYDGTLAPIVADRRQAVMRNSTRALLAQVARRYPTLIITGRGRMDVRPFLMGIESLEVIGNHGLEAEGVAVARFVRQVRQWHADLDERLETVAGLVIEDKRYSLALHYRHCADRDAARSVALRAINTLDNARVVGGKDVLNVLPSEAPDKGQALLAAMARHDCRRAIFVGDDDTDEDVFALKRPDQILTIRVGEAQTSAADYFLHDQEEMDALLSTLQSRAGIDGPAGARG